MPENILICTVGGSHQPIVKTLRELRPDHVCFVCTDKDPGTGQPGSRHQIEGKGNIIKARFDDPSPTLPNIPAQCGLNAEGYEVLIVPADHLDEAHSAILERIDELKQAHPEAAIQADYTGGTKTMTAALIIACLEHPDIQLRLVTGARANLVQVHDGTEFGTPAMVDGLRLKRAMAPFLEAWKHHGYAEAALGLKTLQPPADAKLRGDLNIATDLSRAFDAWDRFDHAAARDTLKLYRPRIGAQSGLLFKFLEYLCLDASDPRHEPARLHDLWLNAQRRAAQGRYDDAIARAYRLLEWTAQWLLRAKGIDTADLQAEQLPPDMAIAPNRNGKRQAGLANAWKLVAHHLDEPARGFAIDQEKTMLDHLLARNQSILAHGFQPLSEPNWHAFAQWLEAHLLPVLGHYANAAGLRLQPPQLPTRPLW